MNQQSGLIQLSKNPVKLVIWFVILFIGFWIIWNIFTTVLIFSIASFIAYLVTPAIAWLSEKKIPWTKQKFPWIFSALIVYLAMVGVLVIFTLLITPLIVAQAASLEASIPAYLKKAEASAGAVQLWYKKLHVSPVVEATLKSYGGTILEKVTPVFSSFAANLAGGLLKIVSAFFIALASFVVSLYIAIDEKGIRKNFVEMFPVEWRKDTEELLHNVGNVVGAFIRGQIILSAAAGSGTYLVLLLIRLLGIPFDYSLIAAFTAGILYPIPFIGVWGPRILFPILAYFQFGGFWPALSVFIAMSGMGVIVDNVFLPVVMGKGVGISPLMVLFVVFAGGELFGIWGLILSVPSAAVIRLIFFYLQKHFAI